LGQKQNVPQSMKNVDKLEGEIEILKARIQLLESLLGQALITLNEAGFNLQLVARQIRSQMEMGQNVGESK